MSGRRLLCAAAMLAAAAIGAGAAAGPPAAPGLYSAAEAAQGAELYAARCAMCHGRALEGTHEVPGLTGKFVANWAGRPLGDLSAYLGRAMPQFAPGSLSAEETGRLVAFLLQANGYPAEPATRASAPAATSAKTVLPAPPPPH